ncbi:MAG: magnesium/cobalt transporter CorA [Planctomycetota bacterium]|jgi:magnesium transporter
MPRFIKKRSDKLGLPPGTPVHVGERKAGEVTLTVFDFDESACREHSIEQASECAAFRDSPTVTWINVDGVHDVSLIEDIGRLFGLHPLVLEDIANTGQRPKMEDYEDHVYVVLKMLSYDEESAQVAAEQVSLILAQNVVVSFQEREGDVFDGVRDRIRSAKGRIRKMGADYLVYALLDAIVDSYFVLCEILGEMAEPLQEELVAEPSPRTLQAIHGLKAEVLFLRKALWPLREVVGGLARTESELFEDSTRLYLRDVYDHTIQVIETIETYRDMVSGMVDIYLSSVSNRMNQVMKVLTIIATIFIPLGFIAGVYGMNFQRMPELAWRWGYPFALGVMLAVAGVMLLYFRKRGWI